MKELLKKIENKELTLGALTIMKLNFGVDLLSGTGDPTMLMTAFLKTMLMTHAGETQANAEKMVDSISIQDLIKNMTKIEEIMNFAMGGDSGKSEKTQVQKS